ncbi:hypothetical protein C8J57DRAFT_1709502 [Mycena rebaudengoi]|nr:hypothetical protein C8J57DRAFT_1709502 [Mycena rebaudengoi]
MAFPTSSSAFGIKSSAPANASVFGQKPATGSVFGAQPQQSNSAFGQPQAGGAFGQNQTGGAFGQPQGGAFGQNQPATGGLFGQPQQQQATGGNIFGQPQQQQQQQPAAGTNIFGQPQQATGTGLFGQTQNQQPAAGGGLFGGQQHNQQAPAAGGLFGGQQQAAPVAGGLFSGQQQNQQAAPAGGLFGNQQPAGGGLFGSTTQQPAASGSGLFGSNPLFGAPKPMVQPTLGLFGGNNQQQQQQQSGSLWGANNSTNTNQGGLFSLNNNSNSMFGAKPQQQQQPLGMQSAQGPPPFTKSTKFNDLPDAMKKTLEEIDSHIQGRIQISKELHQRKLGEEATKGQDMIRTVHKELINTTTAIRNDLHFTRDLKSKADVAVQDTIVATRLIDGFRNPHANAAYLKDHAGFPLEFFTRVTTQMRERLAWYKSTIEQIERKLSSSAGSSQYTPQGIHATLQAQHETFLALAAKTAAADAQLQRIKQLYTQLWRARTGSHRDPFEGDGEDRADLGFGGLSV